MTKEEYNSLSGNEWLWGFGEYHFVLRRGSGCTHTLQLHFDVITNSYYWTLTINSKKRFIEFFTFVDDVPEGVRAKKEDFFTNNKQEYILTCECGQCERQ